MNKLIASARVEGRERRLYANVTPSTTYSYKLWAVGETIAVRGTMLPKVASLVRRATDDRSLIEGVISLLSGNALSDAQSREPQYADHYIADDDSESHNEAIAALQTTLDARQLQSK
jgi:hypothetical protein